MRLDQRQWRVTATLAFLVAVIGLMGVGFLSLAGRRWQVQPTFHARAQFDSIGGLEAGARVRVQGIEAGVIERIVPPSEPGKPVELILRIDRRLQHLVREDATARIVSQGFVGLKLVEIVPGLPSTPPIQESGLIRSESLPELNDLIASARKSLERVDKSVDEVEKGISQVRSIVDSVARGEGSLGKLIRDDNLANKLESLSRRGEETLTDLQENLDAIKHTWPVSRYFNERAYFDRDRILFQPSAARSSRTLLVDEAFEPGRSILTERGKQQLDEVARWFQSVSRPNSEVVIAAFADDRLKEDQTEILTQSQAEAVRNYLVRRYSIDSAGWFRGRKVAAVGFGSRKPEAGMDIDHQAQLTPRRVDVIVFTPRT